VSYVEEHVVFSVIKNICCSCKVLCIDNQSIRSFQAYLVLAVVTYALQCVDADLLMKLGCVENVLLF